MVRRLLEECQLALGAGAACPDDEPTPELSDQRLALQVDLCNIADPSDADADCLRTAACEDIERGACFEGDEVSAARGACLLECTQAEFRCSEACRGRRFEACADCERDCAEAQRSFRDDCPD